MGLADPLRSSGVSTEAIRIFDEGYGIVDVYVHLAESMDDEPLFGDVLVGIATTDCRPISNLGIFAFRPRRFSSSFSSSVT
jgi:hypothetical protein